VEVEVGGVEEESAGRPRFSEGAEAAPAE
jgi:hypothetical protein